jgi:hypothetical protein
MERGGRHPSSGQPPGRHDHLPMVSATIVPRRSQDETSGSRTAGSPGSAARAAPTSPTASSFRSARTPGLEGRGPPLPRCRCSRRRTVLRQIVRDRARAAPAALLYPPRSTKPPARSTRLLHLRVVTGPFDPRGPCVVYVEHNQQGLRTPTQVIRMASRTCGRPVNLRWCTSKGRFGPLGGRRPLGPLTSRRRPAHPTRSDVVVQVVFPRSRARA